MRAQTLNWSHQDELFNPTHAHAVTVLGCGAVGSQAIEMLARCGATRITTYDDDSVNSHNVPMSLSLGLSDLSRSKVNAISERVRREVGLEINTFNARYTGEPLSGSVLSCVDTMEEGRMRIWKQVRMNPNVSLFVDTRTDKHFISIFAIRPCIAEDIAYYESRLYPQEETTLRTCGSHGIVYVSAMAAAMAVRALTGFWSGDTPRTHERILFGSNGTQLISSPDQEEAHG